MPLSGHFLLQMPWCFGKPDFEASKSRSEILYAIRFSKALDFCVKIPAFAPSLSQDDIAYMEPIQLGHSWIFVFMQDCSYDSNGRDNPLRAYKILGVHLCAYSESFEEANISHLSYHSTYTSIIRCCANFLYMILGCSLQFLFFSKIQRTETFVIFPFTPRLFITPFRPWLSAPLPKLGIIFHCSSIFAVFFRKQNFPGILYIRQLSATVLSSNFANLRQKSSGGTLPFGELVFSEKKLFKTSNFPFISILSLTASADFGRSRLFRK